MVAWIWLEKCKKSTLCLDFLFSALLLVPGSRSGLEELRFWSSGKKVSHGEKEKHGVYNLF